LHFPPDFAPNTKDTKLKSTFFAPAPRRLKSFQPAICRQARTVLALALAILILLPSFALTVSAHAPLPASTSSDNDYFMLYAGPDGDTICRAATAAERGELEKITPKNLRQINHLGEKSPGLSTEADNDLPQHLTIILRATTNLENNPAAKAAFVRAAAEWENIVMSPVTIYIDADFGPDNFGAPWSTGVLGSTSAPSGIYSYAFVRNNLISGANTAAKSAVYNALPASSVPVDVNPNSSTNVSVSNSIGRAIGLLDPTAQPGDGAPRIGFNGSINSTTGQPTFNFDFDRNNGITGIDFESVATHEIGHALGFTSRAGSGSATPAMWDLYRFRTGTTSGTFTTATRVMTIGGTPDPLQFYFVPGDSELGLSNGGPSGASDNGADGNQSSHWKQASLNGGYIGIMDPRIPSNVVRPITNADINALNIFGYNSNLVGPPPPPGNDNFAAAQVITGCSGSVNGSNAGATHETGEPNHSPDNGGGNRSIWYQWTAPSTGSVTFTTAGSAFDTVMGVYTGTSVDALTAIGKADDNNATDKTSTVTFNATSGTVYRIAVDGYNNSNSGGDFGPVVLNWTASNCGNSVFAINQTSYQVNENAGSVTITVNRLNGASEVASVNYATSDTAGLQACSVNNGIASERCDYATTVGTLRFASGETSKSFLIPIVDDALVEGPESFTVTLSAPSSGMVSNGFGQVQVQINDNDAAPATQNPIDGVQFFVTQQYIDFLGRLPDSIGLANWVATLGNCPNGGFGEFDNPSCDRVHVSAGFFQSDEFQQRGYFAYRFYEVAVDRRPTYAEFVPDMSIVGGAQSPESEALSKAAYTDAWVLRPEFQTRYNGLSNSAYVNALEANAEVTVSNKAALISALDGNSMTRAQVLRNIVESQAVADRFFNRAFVAMQYFGYLRRDPDTVGFNNWVNTLNADPSNFRHMIFGFLFSTEYRQRFGP
jgi:Calx-beta domain